MSQLAQLPVSAISAAAAVFCYVGSSRRKPPKNTRTGCICTRKLIAATPPRENPGGDQLARLVHRGVGSSLQLMVQYARVVVGTMVPVIHDSAAAVLLAVLGGA